MCAYIHSSITDFQIYWLQNIYIEYDNTLNCIYLASRYHVIIIGVNTIGSTIIIFLKEFESLKIFFTILELFKYENSIAGLIELRHKSTKNE